MSYFGKLKAFKLYEEALNVIFQFKNKKTKSTTHRQQIVPSFSENLQTFKIQFFLEKDLEFYIFNIAEFTKKSCGGFKLVVWIPTEMQCICKCLKFARSMHCFSFGILLELLDKALMFIAVLVNVLCDLKYTKI